MHQLGRNREQDEVEADQRCCRKRVGDAALKDQVHVHQAVAHDRPGECQRQDDERGDRCIPQQLGRVPVEQVRQHVQTRKRQHTEQGTAKQPLQLLPLKNLVHVSLRAPVLHGKQQGRQQIKGVQVRHGGLVKPMRQQLGGLPAQLGIPLQADDQRRRGVTKTHQEEPAPL